MTTCTIGTSNTEEMCAGVVKAQGIYPKNPSQHAADLSMLHKRDKLKMVFNDPVTGQPKPVVCIRVDGASDEGPAHLEVQFWWANYHHSHGNLVTLVLSRSSGSSYLNRVELQNGCLMLAHSNLFIPSTLNGSCISPDTGRIDDQLLKENLELATEVYINRCDGCPCGKTVIHLYNGANSENLQVMRPALQVFLKGTAQKKQNLKKEKPELYSFFECVWSVRCNYMVTGLPENYQFYLRCCHKQGCPHPRCQTAEESALKWYPGGPPLTFVPLPIPDPKKPWGSSECGECSGPCSGHYLRPNQSREGMDVASRPPL